MQNAPTGEITNDFQQWLMESRVTDYKYTEHDDIILGSVSAREETAVAAEFSSDVFRPQMWRILFGMTKVSTLICEVTKMFECSPGVVEVLPRCNNCFQRKRAGVDASVAIAGIQAT